jgi:DnaJ family protein C protein 2
VFERNTKWCIDTKVPNLGDDSTPISQVNKFYAFWYSTKSWRDFSYLDEYDPEDAESREEKRWMERRNAKERSKREGAEQTRVRNLVDLSFRLDPRIRKMKEQEQKEKQEEGTREKKCYPKPLQ